jgi:exodeoxyribonuclease-3
MPLPAERQPGAGPEIRLQAALVRTADELRPKPVGQRRAGDPGRGFQRHADGTVRRGFLEPAKQVGTPPVDPIHVDVYAPERWVDDALFRPEMRDAYRRLVEHGWTDALRALHPGERIYTFWKYFRNAFARDARLRIDHLLLSPAVAGRLVDAGVEREVRAREKSRDHAPVWIDLAEAGAAARGR